MSKDLVARDGKGRFVPGQSGNPEGKAKGLKNYITHERLMLESALRDYVGQPEQAQKLLDGINRVLEIALHGDDKNVISAMKLLLDRVMPQMPPKEADEAETTDRRLEIIIRTNPNAKVPVQAVIDGDFTEIEDTEMDKSKQSSDAAQGGEGTVSLHNKGYDALTKNIGTPPGNTQATVPAKDEGTK